MSEIPISIPVSSPVYADDLAQSYTPDGAEGPIAFRAPIDMQPGDVCHVNLADGTLYKIVRDGVPVWTLEENERKLKKHSVTLRWINEVVKNE